VSETINRTVIPDGGGRDSEAFRHEAGILHRRPHTSPANETTVFLRVETLAHFILWINLDDPARSLYVLFVYAKSKHPSPTITLDIIRHDRLL
jgi:hypothetical protein